MSPGLPFPISSTTEFARGAGPSPETMLDFGVTGSIAPKTESVILS